LNHRLINVYTQGLPAPLSPETRLEAAESNAVAVIPAASRVALTVPPVLAGSLNARHVLTGIELLQKIVKGQFCLPAHFRSSFHSIWRTALTS
jgi:hypothetical protein